MRTQKTHFRFFKEERNWLIDYWWKNQKGQVIRLAGKPKFFLQALVELYWKDEAMLFEQKLIKAFERSTTYKVKTEAWEIKCGSLVMYSSKNDNKSTDMTQTIQQDESREGVTGWAGA